jgi:hypothetical protein
MSYKRGSLSISTNAIVVLIIAVIMLGLIIGLVTRGFGAVEQQFMERIQQTEDNAPPTTGTTPITTSRQTIVSSAGQLVGIKVGIRNIVPATTAGDTLFVKPGDIECQGMSTDNDPVTEDSQQVFAQELSTGETAEFTYIFRLKDTLTPNRYLCRLKASSSSTDGGPYATNDQITPYAQFTLTIE